MMMILGAICIAGAVVLYVLQPILTGQQAPLDRVHDEPTEAESRKRVTLLALRDVEYDHAAGKLDDEDYRQLREELTLEALAALQALSEDATPDEGDALERQIAEYRAALRAEGSGGIDCAACGGLNVTPGRFCAHCGAPMTAPAQSADG